MTPEITDGRADLFSMAFWHQPPAQRAAFFARLRQLDHPMFFPEAKVYIAKQGKGYYALVRHDDVSAASRDATVFSSEPCANSVPDLPRWTARYFGSMINMDDPEHARIRRVVSRAFTPRVLAKAESDIQRAAGRIVDDLIAAESADFVPAVAARLPLWVICDMMGIPESERAMVRRCASIILGNEDPEYTGSRRVAGSDLLTGARGFVMLMGAARRLRRLAMDLGRQRRERPTDDLTSMLVNANVDGEHLTAQQLGSFFILLVLAGAETTSNAIAHGLSLLTGHPEQRALLTEDFDAHITGAVNEIVRYSTPVIWFRRTLTRDHEMNGHSYAAGDKVVLFYNSANRDETVFTDPDTFDITRDPNPHVGFGGPGPHYCLGAHLAKREVTAMFRELLRRLPDIRAVGEPERLTSSFINGIKHLPCEFTVPVQR
jgi:cytochrome P450